jgi:long-subunit acyl-CoA synthetase (AMP-forming)
MLAKGGCVGYWQGEIPKVLADIGACRPTLFCGVPRVFDRIYAGINDQLAANWLKRLVFWFCMARKKFFMQRDVKYTVVRVARRPRAACWGPPRAPCGPPNPPCLQAHLMCLS